jgi:hypothetical protein
MQKKSKLYLCAISNKDNNSPSLCLLTTTFIPNIKFLLSLFLAQDRYCIFFTSFSKSEFFLIDSYVFLDAPSLKSLIHKFI